MDNKDIAARLTVIERAAVSLAQSCRELTVMILDAEPTHVVGSPHDD